MTVKTVFEGKVFFCDIVVQSKDDVEDFRAFLHCRNSKGENWELRGYGKTAGEAAQDAWDKFVNKDWSLHGYVTDG